MKLQQLWKTSKYHSHHPYKTETTRYAGENRNTLVMGESNIPRSYDSQSGLKEKDIKNLKDIIIKVGLLWVYIERTLHHDNGKYPFLSTHL